MISVVIPVRNRADGLRACLDSLMAQRTGDFEVIVVDDASSDDTPEKASGYPVRVMTLPRRMGSRHARAVGVGEALGDVVAFLDSDCVAPSDWLERIALELPAGDGVVGIGGVYRTGNRSALFARLVGHELDYLLFDRQQEDADFLSAGNSAFLAGPLRVQEREVIERGGRGFSGADDTEMCLSLRRSGYRLRFLSDLYVEHRAVEGPGRYFLQQMERGRSRFHVSVRHFRAKVLRTGDISPAYAAAHVTMAGLCLGGVATTALHGAGFAVRLGWLLWLALQLPMARYFRAREEGIVPSILAFPMGILRDTAWIVGLTRAVVELVAAALRRGSRFWRRS